MYQIHEQVHQTQITSVRIAVILLFKYTPLEVINREKKKKTPATRRIREKREKLDSLPQSLV